MQAPVRLKWTLTTSWVTVAVFPKYEVVVVLLDIIHTLSKMQQTAKLNTYNVRILSKNVFPSFPLLQKTPQASIVCGIEKVILNGSIFHIHFVM